MRRPAVFTALTAVVGCRRSPHGRDRLARRPLTSPRSDTPFATGEIVAAGAPRRVFR